MFSGAVLGVVATLASGLLQGTMLTPMRYLRQWRWENTWVMFAGFGYLFLPWFFALATVPHLFAVYGSTSAAVLVRTALFGFGWGCAAVLFGLGIDRVGLALGYAIILGLGTSVGSLVPLVTLEREKLWTEAGLGTILAVFMLLASVVLLALAGKGREMALEQEATKGSSLNPGLESSRSRFLRGLVLCVLCGVLNPLLNFALAYGAEIQSQATRYGAAPATAANAIWLVVANAGFIPNLAYCVYLLTRNSSWRLFGLTGPNYWGVSAAMGFMWISGTVLYGVGANSMGPLGPVIGWPLLMCSIILTATFWGFVAGEWRGVYGSPLRIMAGGLTILIGAIVVLGWCSRI